MPAHGYLLPTRGAVVASRSATELTARTGADVVGLARRAEALGFDAVWVGDSVLAKPRLEPLSTLAAVATATDAVALGTAVYLPALRHPVHVAHGTATVDQLSGGRLAFGVGVGVRPAERREAERLGVPFGRRGRLVNEALDLIVALWSGESVTHGGEFFEVEEAGIGFSPARRPPIYVASAAIDPSGPFPSTVRDRLERFGDGWLPISVRPDAYAAGLERVRDLAGEGNRIDPAYYQDVVVADTEEEALARARAFYRGYYDEDGATYGGGGLSDDEIRERGAFGPPGRIRDHLDDYEAAGVETFVTRFVGSNQRDQLSRFAAVLSR